MVPVTASVWRPAATLMPRANGCAWPPRRMPRSKRVPTPRSRRPNEGRLFVTTMSDTKQETANAPRDSQWPLWEVFVQPPGGEPHEHAGSVHAVDAESALQNARDVYARRGEAVSIWVVRSGQITASTPDDMGPFFDPGNDKP